MEPEDRIAENEAVFREVNERIEAGQWPTGRGDPVAFRCECGSLRCGMMVQLTLDDYERVRVRSTQFMLVPGHEIPEIEKIVERAATYVVVEKLGEAADVAEETDPRDS